LQWMMRSMSRWKQVRSSHSGSGLSLPALLRARTPREQTSSSSARSLFSLGQLMGLTSFATIFAYTILILRSPQKPSIFPKKFSAA
jgi:hypothetical protein